MTRPSRRGVLGGLAVLGVPLLPALVPASAPSPDAALIVGCARYLELEAWLASPDHPQHALDYDDMDEAAECDALEEMLTEAEPKTPEGMAALARAALLCTSAMDDHPWDGAAGGLARTLLLALAGPKVAQEEEERRATNNAMIEANWATMPRPETDAERLARIPEGPEREAFRGIASELERIRKAKGEAA